MLGAVLLNRRSVKDSLGHGKKPSNEKLMAFYCLKQVIEQGVLIAENFALPNESGHWKSANVLIDNVEHIVTVLIRNDANCQRMYLHSVIQKQLLALDYAETENLIFGKYCNRLWCCGKNNKPRFLISTLIGMLFAVFCFFQAA